jgi:hypothetical protein
VVALRQQGVAEVRTQEAGATSDEDELAFPVFHRVRSFTLAGRARRRVRIFVPQRGQLGFGFTSRTKTAFL